jgi:hypothetical protein
MPDLKRLDRAISPASETVEQIVTPLSEIDTTDNCHEALKKLLEAKDQG